MVSYSDNELLSCCTCSVRSIGFTTTPSGIRYGEGRDKFNDSKTMVKLVEDMVAGKKAPRNLDSGDVRVIKTSYCQ